MAKYIDQKILVGGFYAHIAVVDVFVRKGYQEGNNCYPVISLDILKSKDRIGIVFTLPVLAITIGYISKGKM